MLYNYNITIASMHTNSNKSVVVTCNYIDFEDDGSASLNFNQKIKPTLEDLASATLNKCVFEAMGEDKPIQSVNLQPLPEDLPQLLRKVRKIDVTLQMAISSDQFNQESPSLWKNLIPTIAKTCVVLFAKQFNFYIYTQDGCLCTCDKNTDLRDTSQRPIFFPIN